MCNFRPPAHRDLRPGGKKFQMSNRLRREGRRAGAFELNIDYLRLTIKEHKKVESDLRKNKFEVT